VLASSTSMIETIGVAMDARTAGSLTYRYVYRNTLLRLE
jgi:hypothetical protein